MLVNSPADQDNPGMTRKLLLTAAIFLGLISSARADGPSTQPAIPASGAGAKAALAASPRHGEWVDVPMGDIKIHTWVVYPERKDKAPVVLVIHEIFGMSDWVQSLADQVAAEGYIAVAPDMLSGLGPDGGGTESLGDKVGQNIHKLSLDDQVKRLDAVREYAIALPSATGKTASIGFCWGGGVSFAYATQQPKLNAAVVFYGTPPKGDALANIPCPVLGLYGGDDARVSSTVDGTVKSMNDLHKPYDPHIFDGAGHGFMRQQEGRNGANQKAAEQAWALTVDFLKKNLEQQ
ncbi:MAG TPA: dienelactone hydrolase family protein [Tepidisphaeraceae bacterium]